MTVTIQKVLEILQRYCRRWNVQILFNTAGIISESDKGSKLVRTYRVIELADVLEKNHERECHARLLNEIFCMEVDSKSRLGQAIVESKAVLAQTKEKNDET